MGLACETTPSLSSRLQQQSGNEKYIRKIQIGNVQIGNVVIGRMEWPFSATIAFSNYSKDHVPPSGDNWSLMCEAAEPLRPSNQGFFSRDVLLGGNCFCGERKCEEYPKKNKTKFVIVWGGKFKT